MPIIEVLGEKLFFQEITPKTPKIRGIVLFLHGLGANSSSWGLQFPELSRAGYWCFAVDLPGFGKSPYRKTAVNPAGMAQVVAAFIQKRKLHPCHIVGLSLGGMVALELGLRYAGSLASLTLASTAANLRPRRLNTALYYGLRYLFTFLLGKEAQAQLVARRVFPLETQMEFRQLLRSQIGQADARAYRGSLKSLIGFDVRSQLSLLSIPSLILTGTRDTTISPEKQLEMSRAIKPWRHVYMEDAGHALPVEEPDQFNQILIEFLNMLGAKIPGPSAVDS